MLIVLEKMLPAVFNEDLIQYAVNDIAGSSHIQNVFVGSYGDKSKAYILIDDGLDPSVYTAIEDLESLDMGKFVLDKTAIMNNGEIATLTWIPFDPNSTSTCYFDVGDLSISLDPYETHEIFGYDTATISIVPNTDYQAIPVYLTIVNNEIYLAAAGGGSETEAPPGGAPPFPSENMVAYATGSNVVIVGDNAWHLLSDLHVGIIRKYNTDRPQDPGWDTLSFELLLPVDATSLGVANNILVDINAIGVGYGWSCLYEKYLLAQLRKTYLQFSMLLQSENVTYTPVFPDEFTPRVYVPTGTTLTFDFSVRPGYFSVRELPIYFSS